MTASLMIVSGSAAGFLSVALGAFAAHAMKGRYSPEMMTIFETGVRYQMYHALALLAAGLLSRQDPLPVFHAAGLFFLAGVLIFSGSLYLLVITGIRTWGAVTPLGGLLLLAGWASLTWGAIRLRAG